MSMDLLYKNGFLMGECKKSAVLSHNFYFIERCLDLSSVLIAYSDRWRFHIRHGKARDSTQKRMKRT